MTRPRITVELRKNPRTRRTPKDEADTLDEALLYVNGECVMHLEQLNESQFYLGLSHGPIAKWIRKGRRKWPSRKYETMLTVGAKNCRSHVETFVTQER
jgi:hypothetical protein